MKYDGNQCTSWGPVLAYPEVAASDVPYWQFKMVREQWHKLRFVFVSPVLWEIYLLRDVWVPDVFSVL